MMAKVSQCPTNLYQILSASTGQFEMLCKHTQWGVNDAWIVVHKLLC